MANPLSARFLTMARCALKSAAARKKQKTADLKEIKMRPNIDTHDYMVKAKAITRFFEQGDKVKVTLRFRGREMAHQHLGMELLQRVKEEFDEMALSQNSKAAR